MGLIERAIRALKELPNFTNNKNTEINSNPKKSFLKQIENLKHTSSHAILEEEIPQDNPFPTEDELEAKVTKEDILIINEEDEIIIDEEVSREDNNDSLIDLDAIEDEDDFSNQVDKDEKSEIHQPKEIKDDLIDDTDILEDWERDALNDEVNPIEEFNSTVFEEDKEIDKPNSEKNISDNYFVLVETTKEILKSKSFDDFFQSLMYSLIGQVGIESILVFSSKLGNFSELNLIASEGVELDEKFTFTEKDYLYKKLEKSEKILSISELTQENFSELENKIISISTAELFIPIHVNGQFSGFIITGKRISVENYSETDLDFMKNLVDISSNFLSKLLDYENLNLEISELNKVLLSNNRITSFADKIYSSISLEEVYNLTSEFFINDFKIKKFSLLVIESFHNRYKIFASNTISDELIDTFYLPSDSKIITMISQLSAIYKLENPQENTEIASLVSKNNQHDFIMIPLLNMKRLFGIFIIHELSFELSPSLKQALVSIGNIIAPIISNILVQKEKDTLYKDPFNPLHSIIEKEIGEANVHGLPFTLIVIKILNINRIFNILGLNFYSEYIEFISKTIQENIEEKDYISRIGQGKFAVLLKGFNQADSEKFIQKIKSKIVLFHNPSKDFKLSIQVYSLEYPKQAKEKRKFIEMLEET